MELIKCRVELSSPSPCGISPEEQVCRKTSSIVGFDNLALSDRKVTVTAGRQPSLERGGGGEVPACELGDGKISFALNEELELQWVNSVTAPLGWSEPAGNVQLSLCPGTHRVGASELWYVESSTALPPLLQWDVGEDTLPVNSGGSQVICRQGTGDAFIIRFPHYSLNAQRIMHECSQLLAGVFTYFGSAV